jgi:hypothetical protein
VVNVSDLFNSMMEDVADVAETFSDKPLKGQTQPKVGKAKPGEKKG